ncbi:MAG: hypothetical protein QM723_08360 [Myxococcaceae bacterium]
MRVIDTAPSEAPLVTFELEVDASSAEEARQLVARYGASKLQAPFIEALGAASDADLDLLTRVSQLGGRGIDFIVDQVSGQPPRFKVKLTAYPGALR